MRILRKPFIKKIISALLLLIFLQSIVQPYYVFALTTGPHQPEYIAYESPGSTDMVNLLTGDFTYSLPVVEVPGPEGGFSLPLTYNAGIGTDQEASWVGLGWNINAGAITRTINEFPDDASGESNVITVQDAGVRGWSSSLLGLGQAGWNTEQGHYGTVTFVGISWSSAGVEISNPIAFMSAAFSVVSLIGAPLNAAVDAAATTATTPAATSAASQGLSKAASLGINLGTDMMMNFAMGHSGVPNSPAVGAWEYSKRVKNKLLYKDYWIWLDQTRVEDMLGIMYLQQGDLESYTAGGFNVTPGLKINNNTALLKKFPKTANNKGCASDITYYLPDGPDYEDVTSPALPAFDNFAVNAPGIGGTIRPYRLDIGTVSMPRRMTTNHERLVPLPYQSYKVPFIYEGSPSGNYFHHVGKASGSITTPQFYFGISKQTGSGTMTYNFDDVIFDAQRVAPAINSTKRVPQGNHVEYLTNEEIKDVTGGFSNGFMDYFQGSARNTFRGTWNFGPLKSIQSASATFGTDGVVPIYANDDQYFSTSEDVDLEVISYPTEQDWINGENGTPYSYSDVDVTNVQSQSVTLDANRFSSEIGGTYCQISVLTTVSPTMPKSIGGFSITGTDGMTYHFALPVYDYSNYTSMVNKNDASKKTIISRNEPFATTWLLTGITGPDFIDRGGGTGADPNGVIDNADWGYWVKFNYGKSADNFKWRFPYEGTQRDPTDVTNVYSHGFKQLYYLNSIETRSHAALFLKEARNDNRSANGQQSLALKEICLLSREHYDKLFTSAPAGFGLNSVSGTVSELLTVDDFYSANGSHPAQGNFIIANTLKRIKFSQNYHLCHNTPNSTDVNKGKLTLNRVSIIGRNDIKIVPDYLFEYGPNPNYGPEAWDAFGMYKSGSSGAAHAPTDDGTAWSLTKITTPLGATLEVSYERDTYSSVSGVPIQHNYPFRGIGGVDFPDPYSGPYINQLITFPGGTGGLSEGQTVDVTGTVTYNCDYPNNSVPGSMDPGPYTIVAVTSNSISISPPAFTIQGCSGSARSLGIEGTVSTIFVNKLGGNLRVASIKMSDNSGVDRKLRYIYNDSNGKSTGVISKEPIYAAETNYDSHPGYPFTPVMYGKVTVLQGLLTTDQDYTVKQVYEFETPSLGMIVPDTDLVEDSHPFLYDWVKLVDSKIENFTSEIGNIISIKTYDKAGNETSSVTYDYTHDIANPGNALNNQGVYTDGTLMCDAVRTGLDITNKITRTTVIYHPTMLKEIVTVKDGLTSSVRNDAWDFLSGQVLERTETSSLGVKIQTSVLPAYEKYPDMGSKAVNLGYKNMLAQNAASYTYKVDNAGQRLGLIGATAQTWRKDWSNYRSYDPVTSTFSDADDEPAPVGVWRKAKSYTWKGDYSRLQQPGDRQSGIQTFSSTDEFNFSTLGSNPGWQYAGEVIRFDHFGMPLQSQDMNSINSSVKMGYRDRMIIASAVNARFDEIAFSGAEDLQSDRPFFGSEVGLGDGTVKYLNAGASSTHTGEAVVSVSSGHSFVFKANALDANKRYRASVWANSTSGRIYYKINGGTENLSAAPTKSANGWYRIDLALPIQSSAFSLEVGVASTGGEVHFDDFRFQPVESAMTCYVYPPLSYEFPSNMPTNNFTYVLDNNNMFTQYEHSPRGQLLKTYAESFTYGVKLISESKDNYRRFHVNP